MKILMVSMLNYHFVRWTEQLKDSEHEIFWFDINDNGYKVDRLSWINQKVGWKLKYNLPFRFFVKRNFPSIYKIIQKYNERKIQDEFEKYLIKVQPDIVHSFALYISCAPILQVMNKYQNIKWIYSSWGSDLYDLQNNPNDLKDIQNVLKRINYLFTDCIRDYKIAQSHGFKNVFLGVLPGGGGYYLDEMNSLIETEENKKGIIVKGFQGRWGRAINVLKALIDIEGEIKSFSITIFGADEEVIDFIRKSSLANWENITLLGKIKQEEVFSIMGKSNIYIGNSISDGMPNTMLEAICMRVFPIQSNPGGVTQELIKDGFNGFLIQDAEDIDDISRLIVRAINNNNGIKKGIAYNSLNITPNLDYNIVKKKVLQSYLRVLQDN